MNRRYPNSQAMRTETANYTTTKADGYIRCNHATTPFTITLHAATGSGQCLVIKNIGAATVTVDGNSSEVINNQATITLRQWECLVLVDSAAGVWDSVSSDTTAGGTMTGAVEFSSATAAPTNGIGPNGSGNIVVNGSGSLKLQRAGVDHFEAYGGGNIAYQPIHFSGSQTNGFGNSAVIMWRDSSGNLNVNVDSGDAINMCQNSSVLGYWGGNTYSFDLGNYVSNGTGIVKYSADITTYATTANMQATSSGRSSLSAGGAPGGAYPGVEAYGPSHANNPGAVVLKSKGVARTNNGTWTPIYSLAAGVHTGEFRIRAYNGTNHAIRAIYGIEGSSLNGVETTGSGNDWSFVDAGSAATNNIALRVNSGNLEINVGTAVESNVTISVTFEGMVS